jgi:hypothetical protein
LRELFSQTSAGLGKIQAQMGTGAYLAASNTAEETLGHTAHEKVTALRPAPELLQYLSPNMRAIGDGLHEAASEFAVEAKRAATTGNTNAAWTAMSHIVASCMACQ